ncbi:MAG: hypothetical protein WBN68_03915 [Sedimenticolaceae bacterium]
MSFPECRVSVVVNQDGEFGFPANLLVCCQQSCANTSTPAPRIDIDVLVVSKSAFNIEFSIEQDIRGMKVDYGYAVLADREYLGTHNEAVRP